MASETLKVWKTFIGDRLDVSGSATLPTINSNLLSQTPTVLNGIAFDVVTKRLWYCDNIGTRWHPVGTSASGSGSTFDFAMKKSGATSITPGIFTILPGWNTSPPYFDNALSWNPVTGIYTVTDGAHFVTLTADVSWAANVSNLGSRTVQIILKPLAGAEVILKESKTQADPNVSEPTTISVTGGAALNINDSIYIKVYHNAPIPLVIDATTTITGHRTNP